MSFTYNTGYRSPVTSKELNDKFKLLLGGNFLVSGFNVTPGTGNKVNVSPGEVIIEGCLISEKSETRVLTIPNSEDIFGETYNIYLKYDHTNGGSLSECTLNFAKTSVVLGSNTLTLATIHRRPNATTISSTDIKKVAPVLSDSSLNKETLETIMQDITTLKSVAEPLDIDIAHDVNVVISHNVSGRPVVRAFVRKGYGDYGYGEFGYGDTDADFEVKTRAIYLGDGKIKLFFERNFGSSANVTGSGKKFTVTYNTGVVVDIELDSSEAELDKHMEGIATEKGKHGIRYWNDKLEIKLGDDWAEPEASNQYPVIKNFKGQGNNTGTQITLSWVNPVAVEFKKVQIFMSNSDISNESYDDLILNGNLIVNEKKETHIVTGVKNNDIKYFKAFAVFSMLGEDVLSKGINLQMVVKDMEPPATVTGFLAKANDKRIDLSWINPVDSDFSKVKIMYRQDRYPTSHIDGSLAYDGSGNSVSLTGLVNNAKYYFRAFTFDVNGNINDNITNQQIIATPTEIKIYGVEIDETNSNPETSVIYTDDAAGFTPMRGNNGAFQWGSWEQIFKDLEIKPCVVRNPQRTVNYYLNPDDYTKKLDGSLADITSGADGDVMVEFPKLYWKMWKVGTKQYVQWSTKMFDGAKCPAHTVGDIEKDKIYIPAYMGNTVSGKLRSLSGKTPTVNQTIGVFRTQAQANGVGYQQMGYYPLLMLQVLYKVFFKSKDSQTALGRGYVDGNTAAIATGGANKKGMFYGETTGKQQNKFCGIEDFWGNVYYWIDGFYSDANRNMMIGRQDVFNDTGSGYVNHGQGASANVGGYMDSIQGSTDTGFVIKSSGGSATTHYCDSATLSGSCLPRFGGNWDYGDDAGAFHLDVGYSAAYSDSNFGARLMCFIP